jgi:uncharacterized protein
MIIPLNQLDPDTLSALIEDFVTRDGAVHGHHDATIDQMTATVRAQLKSGTAEIIYDEEDESWTIALKDR